MCRHSPDTATIAATHLPLQIGGCEFDEFAEFYAVFANRQ
jgi:hypothetical protein